MSREVIRGTLYINGYACNDAGQPITMKNGYSSDDEREARTAYRRALRDYRPQQKYLPNKKQEEELDIYTPHLDRDK